MVWIYSYLCKFPPGNRYIRSYISCEGQHGLIHWLKQQHNFNLELKYSRKIEIRFWNYAMVLKIKFKYGLLTTSTPLQNNLKKNKNKQKQKQKQNTVINKKQNKHTNKTKNKHTNKTKNKHTNKTKNEQRPLISNNFIQPFIIINCK